LAESCLACGHKRLLLESPAEVSRFDIFHDLARIADRRQIARHDLVERRAFGAGDFDDSVMRIAEG
jgi:hypothetical protein